MLTVRAEGVQETLSSIRGVSRELRSAANAEIRAAASTAAGALAEDLRRAAASSPTPVARRVAESIRVKSDRFPTVSIGGTKRVGRRGAPAARLVWGSERGGEKFGAPAGGSYWIAPTVQRFETAGAVPIFRRSLFEIVRKYGLA